MEYNNYEQLSNVYFEDSYVLRCIELATEIVFYLEVVLTQNHPLYKTPLPNEQYCYRKAKMRFFGLNKVEWLEKVFHASTDAAGEIDYGNIDFMDVDGQCYHLNGSWGDVIIDCKGLEFIVY